MSHVRHGQGIDSQLGPVIEAFALFVTFCSSFLALQTVGSRVMDTVIADPYIYGMMQIDKTVARDGGDSLPVSAWREDRARSCRPGSPPKEVHSPGRTEAAFRAAHLPPSKENGRRQVSHARTSPLWLSA